MTIRYPKIMSLRCFEAAARLLSFTKAGQELFITQAAVSQQIRALEQNLGCQLFLRQNKQLLLTQQGQQFVIQVRKALENIRLGIEQISQSGDQGVLNISVLPSFAARWLVPRLWRFLKSHPDIEVRIAPSLTLVDLNHSDVDLAIRFGKGEYAGVHSTFLAGDEAFPVCTPELLQTGSLKKPEDLTKFVVIPDIGPKDLTWNDWLKAVNCEHLKLQKGFTVNDNSLAIDAVLSGQGIALARRSLVEKELESGRLIRPFPQSITTEYSYYLVRGEQKPMTAKLRVFCDWLQSEFGGNYVTQPSELTAKS